MTVTIKSQVQQRLAEATARTDQAWHDFRQAEKDAEPHILKVQEARKKWCDSQDEQRGLNYLLAHETKP